MSAIIASARWLDHPHLAGSVARLEQSPTASALLDELRRRPTRLAFDTPPAPGSPPRDPDGFVASYHPATGTIRMPWQVAHPAPDAPFSDDEIALTFAHEGVHRLQDAPRGRLLVRNLVTGPIAAAFAGAREVATSRSAGEGAGAAFLRGADRSLVRVEIDAYLTEGRIARELGIDASATPALNERGELVDAETMFEFVRPRYATSSRATAAAGLTLTGAVTAGTAAQGVSLVQQSREQ